MVAQMRVLIAPDKFKGSMSARQAAEAIRQGLEADAHGRESKLEIRTLPIADGGEGTAEALCDALNGEWVTCQARDALGRPVEAGYALVAPQTAILEMSQASGLWRIRPEERDPWCASTFGTGEMIRHAVNRGATRILLGLGGSATNDGGSGMALALGARFLDAAGAELTDLPANLGDAVRIDREKLLQIPDFSAACDVANPLLGPNGATRVYGPQKGVRAGDFPRHEGRLEHLANLVGGDFQAAAGSGAAGGLGFGCLAFCGAKLSPGFDLVADLLNLEAAICEADLVITGEGSLDSQTLQGKGPHGVANLARRHGKPVLAFAGRTDGCADLKRAFDHIITISPDELPLEEAMRQGQKLLENAAFSAKKWICSQTGARVRKNGD